MTDHPDLYLAVHKGLRHAMHAVLVRLGAADPTDADDVREALGGLRDLLLWMEDHLHVEERFVHAVVEARRAPALLATLRHDHDDHQRAFALLRADADALERAVVETSAGAAARAHHLYLAFSRFVADNLAHMALEETEMNALLSELFTPAEVMGIFTTILGTESLEQLGRSVRWVVPALDPGQRAAALAIARQGIPPEVLEPVLAGIRAALSPRDWAKLESALSLAA